MLAFAAEAFVEPASAAAEAAIAAELALIAREAKTGVAVAVAMTVAEHTQAAFLIAPRTPLDYREG